jgi:hypothetical protein
MPARARAARMVETPPLGLPGPFRQAARRLGARFFHGFRPLSLIRSGQVTARSASPEGHVTAVAHDPGCSWPRRSIRAAIAATSSSGSTTATASAIGSDHAAAARRSSTFASEVTAAARSFRLPVRAHAPDRGILMSNRWMSLLLSTANNWAGAVRGFWTAELHPQWTAMANEMVRRTLGSWIRTWIAPIADHRSKRRR